MESGKEFYACLAFRYSKKLDSKTRLRIFSHYDSAYAALCDARSWVGKGLSGPDAATLFLMESWREKATKEYRTARDCGANVLCWHDPRYPERLRHIPDSPEFLYYQGDVSLLTNPAVGVVGARKCTEFGLQAAFSISRQLSRIGITVVSGMALGIDGQAHRGGLQGLGKSVAVLGCGLENTYPPEHEDLKRQLAEEGCLVSEFPPDTPPISKNFPYRNRIISGLSLGVLVAEAANRSGSLITARLASEQGREVFALPGPLGQPTFTGCHRLIKQGAALVENAADIVHALRYEFALELAHVPDPEPSESDQGEDAPLTIPKVRKASARQDVESGPRPPAVVRKKMALNDEEQALMELLLDADKVHIDSLGRSLGWTSNKTSQTLLMLEMRGAVRQLPGMWYLAREA
ncbi:DNA-processing protein DprA [Salidesulfovibrio onnuriiensis]|uniref:DNA-processing protein DprA n=1 Tax=Salidesulfovibrio onnuriiensis TaxID=2583823 RepID=UPI0011CAC67C|nr:DNA-processing protein DprA [Salidesulfovibrio onnuriiensis]